MSKRGSAADPIYSQFGYKTYAQNNSVIREHRIANMLAKEITELAMNRFKWTGLPDSIDPRFLEMMLFRNGLAIYYYEQNWDKELVVRGTGAGWITVFDNPITFNAIVPGLSIEMSGTKTNVQSSKVLKAYDRMRHSDLPKNEKREYAVPIWANYTRIPDWEKVDIYSTRLATMDRTIEINSNNARRSKILKGTPQTQLSVANANRQVDQGDNVTMVTGALEDLSWIDSIDLGVDPDSYEKLHILRTRTWNEIMGLLGIDNANQDKKERLVAAEVSANDSQTDSMRFVALNARRQACELINDIFGHNISVEFNTEIEAKANMVEQETNVNGSKEVEE